MPLLSCATFPSGHLYNLSRPKHEPIESYDSLASGLIVPSSSMVGAGFFFFVKKKDSTLRSCIDYHVLIELIIRNKCQLPLDAAFATFQEVFIFTKLDLRNAYHLVCICSRDVWKKLFKTLIGHFDYRVMLFGLTNAPGVVQTLVYYVLL